MQLQQLYRHIYSHPSKSTPFHFKFAAASAAFKETGRLGRPQAAFKADCWGSTLAVDPERKQLGKPVVDYDFDPNTAARFPHATSFSSKQEAALECDFWKLVLLKKYFLAIGWSHESLAQYLSAAQDKGQDPYARLADEEAWPLELVDFIEQNKEKLLLHRDLHKPELDLDGFEEHAKRKNHFRLGAWVQCVREAQAELDKFNALVPDSAVDRVQTIYRYLCSIQGSRLPASIGRSRFSGKLQAFTDAVIGVRAVRALGEDLLVEINTERKRLQQELDRLLANRPAI